MNVRKTEVDWDPTLIRVEYLDEKGQPYYCAFEENANDRAAEAPPQGENFPGETTVLVGGVQVETCRPATN